MAISSPGIGSGLDINSIVSQLVALETKPLEQLQSKASSLQTQLSSFGQLKSQMANLQDQVAKLANTSNWGTLTLTSSNTTAVSGALTTGASDTRFSVEVSQLARAQSAASAAVATGTKLGSGTLTIALGQWAAVDADNDSQTDDVMQFTPQTGTTAVAVQVAATDDLSAIAKKINAAEAGVTATVINDANGQRLAIRSVETGEDAGFRIQASNLGSGSALSKLAYDPAGVTADDAGNPSFGSGYTAMGLTESAQNTLATINGVAVASTDNRFDGVVEGVKLTVSQVTTGPVNVSVTQDKASIRTYVKNFVESYNALSNALKEMTKYDPATKTAGSLQGDGTAVSLQAALRRMVSGLGPAESSFKRFSDIGVEFQLDGTLKVNDAKLNTALDQQTDLQAFFTTPGADGANGMAVRLKNFTQGLLNAGGALTTKNQNLQTAIARNTKEQDRITERAERVETRLLAQYSRLDSQLASLTALNDYVAQQVTAWNNQSSN